MARLLSVTTLGGTATVARGTRSKRFAGRKPPEWSGLGDLPGGTFFSVAHAVSADGLVVVGQSNVTNGREAFRWTQSTGMVSLGTIGPTNPSSPNPSSVAVAVNADGTVIVGQSSNHTGGLDFSLDPGQRYELRSETAQGRARQHKRMEPAGRDGRSLLVNAAFRRRCSRCLRCQQTLRSGGRWSLPLDHGLLPRAPKIINRSLNRSWCCQPRDGAAMSSLLCGPFSSRAQISNSIPSLARRDRSSDAYDHRSIG